jgi:hypothetical protein
MESPVWIPLNRFPEALVRETGAALATVSISADPLSGEDRKSLFAATEFESGRLHMRDAFSTNVALLALPHLVRHFAGNPRVPAEWFDLANYA